MPLDPTDARLVLEVYGVKCPECNGSGSVQEGPDVYTCGPCNGTGYHISGATRENWLWWRWDGTGYASDYPPREEPYMPDFPNDDGDSVKLAIQAQADVCFFHDGFEASISPGPPAWSEESIGAALLTALRAAKGATADE